MAKPYQFFLRSRPDAAENHAGGTLVSSTVDAIYEDGVFKPEQPVSFKEKTRVHLVIEDASPAAYDDDPTGWETAERFVGFIKDAPEGEPIAREHHKHLYK
jgi:predicted DNA-binding antitoxin AbrB/MazE fold protein